MCPTRRNGAFHLHGAVFMFFHVEVCSTAIMLLRAQQGLDCCLATTQTARLTAIITEKLLQIQSCVIQGSLIFWKGDHVPNPIYSPSTVYGENTYTSCYTQLGRNPIGHSVWHGGNTANRYIFNYTAWRGSNTSRRPGIFTYIVFICSRFCANNREASERVYISCGPLKLHTVYHAQNKPTRQQHVHGFVGEQRQSLLPSPRPTTWPIRHNNRAPASTTTIDNTPPTCTRRTAKSTSLSRRQGIVVIARHQTTAQQLGRRN